MAGRGAARVLTRGNFILFAYEIFSGKKERLQLYSRRRGPAAARARGRLAKNTKPGQHGTWPNTWIKYAGGATHTIEVQLWELGRAPDLGSGQLRVGGIFGRGKVGS